MLQAGAPGDERSPLGRLLAMVILLAVIVLVTVFFAVRTRGGHEFIVERLNRYVGIDLSVEKMRIGWPYALVLEQVRSAATVGVGSGPSTPASL